MSLAITLAEDEPPLSRQEWLHERTKGVGSSDIAAIVGASPYAGPIDVWLSKTGRGAAGIETRPMRLGTKLEPIILSEFVEETGHEARLNRRLFVHATQPLVRATPDAFLLDGPAGVELKAPGLRMSGHWGRSWSDEYPEDYLAQVAWQMAATDRDEWFLAALLGGQDFRVFHIRRDRDLEAGLIEAAERFWRDYVVPDVCPPLDASEAARRYVESRFPAPIKQLRPATDEEIVLVSELAEIRSNIIALEDAEAAAITRLCERIGDAEGIQIKGQAKVSWKTRRGGISWKAIAETFNPATELIEAHRSADTRVFRPSGRMFPSRREQGREA